MLVAVGLDDERLALPSWALLLVIVAPFAVLFAVVAFDSVTDRLRRRR